MSPDLWWSLLCVASVFNVLAWCAAAAALARRRTSLDPEVFFLRRWQRLLSAGYVFGCAYRAMLPVFDVPRIVLVDSWLSSVVVGRSVATVAELCFVCQWALLLAEVSRATPSPLVRRAAFALVPLILVAETCSWYAVLTTSNIGHVVEESLWGICAALLVASLVVAWPHCRRSMRPLITGLCALGTAYCAYMLLVDIPMYWSRWVVDEAVGRRYFSLDQGLVDASTRWVVSHRWQDWHSEMVWMSLYFSAAVWLSISLMVAPNLQWARLRAGNGSRPRLR